MSTRRIDHFLGRMMAILALALVLPSLAWRSAHAEAPPPQGVVNVNTARTEELMLLPRIGEEKARRIIEQRTRAPFKTVNDLTRVKGIGLRTLRTLKPWVRVEGPTTLTSEARPAPSESALPDKSPRRDPSAGAIIDPSPSKAARGAGGSTQR